MTMDSKAHKIIDTKTVETLLRMRSNEPVEDECLQLEELALALNSTKEESLLKMNEHLQECSLCAQSVKLLQELETEGVIKPCKPPVKSSFFSFKFLKSLSFSNRFIPIAATAVLLVVVSLTIFSNIENDKQFGNLSVKGSGDTFFVAVKRGVSKFLAKPLEKLEQGDKLVFFYSSNASGYLAVFNLDMNSKVTLIYPSKGTSSIKVNSGNEVSLPDGGIVEQGSGCEWLISVFSEEPLLIDDLKSKIADSAKNIKGCYFDLTIPKTRTVQVFSFKR